MHKSTTLAWQKLQGLMNKKLTLYLNFNSSQMKGQSFKLKSNTFKNGFRVNDIVHESQWNVSVKCMKYWMSSCLMLDIVFQVTELKSCDLQSGMC